MNTNVFMGTSGSRYTLIIHDDLAFVIDGQKRFVPTEEFLSIVNRLNETAERITQGKTQENIALSHVEEVIQNAILEGHVIFPAYWIKNQTYSEVKSEMGEVGNCVYFVTAPNHQKRSGFIKIGYSNDLGPRLVQLRKDADAPLLLLCLIRTPRYEALERALHVHFSFARAEGYGKVEWFEASQVRKFLNSLIWQMEVDRD